MISRPFLVALYVLAQARHCISAVSNRTIDDVFGDEISGALPIYTPSPNDWNIVENNNCSTCAVKPDPALAFNQTWHDVTVPVGSTYSVILNFTGTAIYFFGIVPNTVPNADTIVNMTFVLDGASAGTYTHLPNTSTTILYSVPMLSKEGLSNNTHTLVAQVQSSSLLIFDYAIYTFEIDEGITPSTPNIMTPDGSSVSSSLSTFGVNSQVLTTTSFVAPTSAGAGDNSSFPATTATRTVAPSTSSGAGGENPLPPKTTPDTLAAPTSAGAGGNSPLPPKTTPGTLAAPTSASVGGNSSSLATTNSHTAASTSAGTGNESPLLPTTTPDTLVTSTSAGSGESPLPPTTIPDTLAASTSAGTGRVSPLPPTTIPETLTASKSAGTGGERPKTTLSTFSALISAGAGAHSSFPAVTTSPALAASTSAGTGGESQLLPTTTPDTLSALTSTGAGGSSSSPAISATHTLVVYTSAGTDGETPVPAITTPDSLTAPTSSGTGGGSPVSHTEAVTGYTVAGILGLVGIAGLIALANWANQVIQAKKASKPGMFSSKVHEFIFFFPPYLPWPKKEKKKIKAHQITLTLTPVDIEEGYTYQQVVWQRFNIDNGSSQFTARLDYDRAFGTANIRRGRDEINNVSFCDRPLSIGHAKPGRIIPLKGSVWTKPLEFIIRKYNRITARNDTHVPVRMVLGSYICQGSEGSLTESSGDVEEGNVEEAAEHDFLVRSHSTQDVGFQSFVVMDQDIGYAGTLSASFDLILRAYKTHGVEVGQILSPPYLRDQAVPLLGEQGIRISKLPRIATWGIIPNESGIQLKRERTPRKSGKHEVAV
ncbi:hypothetical protein MVEN_01700800 [Mycena venus]|uniref:Uncharacterized protein n=1 Tax=Mycena venus TaxID=2733690 RepID=A0A8H7CNC0_9AGAR|nr:hypothetical protein MVEN_01700800 [Mycena venus]